MAIGAESKQYKVVPVSYRSHLGLCRDVLLHLLSLHGVFDIWSRASRHRLKHRPLRETPGQIVLLLQGEKEIDALWCERQIESQIRRKRDA